MLSLIKGWDALSQPRVVKYSEWSYKHRNLLKKKKKVILFPNHKAMYSCGRINKKEMYSSSHLATLGPSQQGNLHILYLVKGGVVEHGLCSL